MKIKVDEIFGNYFKDSSSSVTPVVTKQNREA